MVSKEPNSKPKAKERGSIISVHLHGNRATQTEWEVQDFKGPKTSKD